MDGELFRQARSGFRGLLAGILLWGFGMGGSAAAQPGAPPAEIPAAYYMENDAAGQEILQAGCKSCGSGLFGVPGPVEGGPAIGGCADGCCYAGRTPCDCDCSTDTPLGKVFCGFYECVCCPDPCYEPRWIALADAALFVETPRTVSQLKLRYDHAWHVPYPDKAEFLFPRADGNGKGPGPRPTATGRPNFSFRELWLFNETAVGGFSMLFGMPYRQVSPDEWNGASGFGDLLIGTKSMLLDCELMQISFAFRTFIPTGNFNKGLGVGHVSLEPALLWALKCSPVSYHQGELAYRIPIGGSRGFEGPVLHYHLSYNHLLWACGHNVQFIGTMEMNGYQVLGGAATTLPNGNPVLISARDVGTTIGVGPGVRAVICDKVDFGIGGAFTITDESMGDQLLRMEFRWRF